MISENKVQFNTKKFKKLNINEIEGYTKQILTISLPFNLIFEEDFLYNEEDDFNKLIKYINNIETLNINIENNIDKALEVIYKIETKINKKIKFINIITQNQTIKEIEKLRFLEEDRTIKIWYEDGITDCTVDEFITMRKNLDKITNEIKQKQLSPLEKIIYVYDVVKKHTYKQSNNMDGRQLHTLFNKDNMVCTGYAKLTAQILNELGIQSGIYKLVTKDKELHTRSLVHIKDEKYNVNKIYSMEPTWESSLKEEYSYTMFLTPIEELKQTFPNETFREDINVLTKEKQLKEISLRDKISLYQFFKNKDLQQQEIDTLLKQATKKVTLEAFKKALINTKIEEGLEKQQIELNVPKIINYNKNLINYINKNMGTNINFFELK